MATAKGTSGIDRIRFDLEEGTAWGYGGNDRITATLIYPAEEVPIDITFYGGSGRDRLRANIGTEEADVKVDLYGGSNADLITISSLTGDGSTRLFASGGSGNDFIDVAAGGTIGNPDNAKTVIVTAGNGDDLVSVDAFGFDTDVKSTVWGGRGDDEIDVNLRTQTATSIDANIHARTYGGLGAMPKSSFCLLRFLAAGAAGDWEAAAERFLRRWGGAPANADAGRRPYMVARMPLVAVEARILGSSDLAGVRLTDLARLRGRRLLLGGAESPATVRAILDVIDRAAPGAERRAVAGAGHMLPITHPEPVAAAIARLVAEGA